MSRITKIQKETVTEFMNRTYNPLLGHSTAEWTKLCHKRLKIKVSTTTVQNIINAIEDHSEDSDRAPKLITKNSLLNHTTTHSTYPTTAINNCSAHHTTLEQRVKALEDELTTIKKKLATSLVLFEQFK